MLPLLILPFIVASASAASYTCTPGVVPVRITAETAVLKLKPPADQLALTAIATELSSAAANMTDFNAGEKTTLTAAYEIASQLCVPDKFPKNGTLEFAIHGIGFDQRYWEFGGRGSKYNYVEAAINAGHAIFIYDRLSTGNSSKPDGIKEVQISTEIEVAAELIKHLRGGVGGVEFGKLVVVGHSFGSEQTVGLAGKHSDLMDGIILTGFSTYGGAMAATAAGMNFKIADPTRFHNIPDTSYVAVEGISNLQLLFFYYPNFTAPTLSEANQVQGSLTLGEILSMGGAEAAPNYRGPVLIVTGAKDYIFCGGNCYQSQNGAANLLEPAAALFPAASKFSTYIPAATGHGVNLQASAPETFEVMQEWIGRVVDSA